MMIRFSQNDDYFDDGDDDELAFVLWFSSPPEKKAFGFL
jgi:hypothetical protein